MGHPTKNLFSFGDCVRFKKKIGEAYNQNDYATVISISSATPSPIAHLVVNAGHGMWVKKCSLSSCFLVSDLEERPVWMGGRVFPSSVVWVEMEGGGEKRRGVALGGRGEESVDILFQDGEVEEISLSRISVGGEKEKKFVEVGDSVRRVRNWKRVLESLRGGVDEEEEKKFSCWEDGVVVGVVEKLGEPHPWFTVEVTSKITEKTIIEIPLDFLF